MTRSNLLSSLGPDVIIVIVEFLYAESSEYLHPLRATCTSLKAICDPILFRSIILREDYIHRKATRGWAKRLLDPFDEIVNYVRHLKITYRGRKMDQNTPPKSGHAISDGKILAIVKDLKCLKSFTWDLYRDISVPVLTNLEEHHPNCKLLVTNHDRGTLDGRLLASPLLNSLSFCILNESADIGITNKLEQYSIFSDLRHIILASPNLRSLDIKFEYHWGGRGLRWEVMNATPRPLNLPLEESDRLPPLRELTFSGPPETYEFDLEHCQMLDRCMDWSHLRRLDLGLSCPQAFFEIIGPKLTRLKSLSMGIRVGSRKYSRWVHGPLTCQSLESVIDFLQTIPTLEELHINDLNEGPGAVIPTIVRHHQTLRRFSYHTPLYWPRPPNPILWWWNNEQLEELRQGCSVLSHLCVDISQEWPREPLKALSRFHHLDSLKVIVQLNNERSAFCAEYHQDMMGSVRMPPLNNLKARDVAIRLFKSFFLHDRYAYLTTLEVCFKHQRQEDRGQKFEVEIPVKVKRMVRDDAPSPLDGGFTVDIRSKWPRVW